MNCSDTIYGVVGKKSFPQAPGRLIFREYSQWMHTMKWPVRLRSVSKCIAMGIARKITAVSHVYWACAGIVYIL